MLLLSVRATLLGNAFSSDAATDAVVESPATLTFSKRGIPPPLAAIEAMSDFIVRIFTSAGGGGAVVNVPLDGN